MTCTGSPLSWSGRNCGRALKSGLKNAFGDAFRRQKCFAEKMEAIWTNSFKIRGKSLYKNIRYARIKFKTFHTEFSIILSVVVVRWSRVEPMALVSDPVTYPFFFPSIFFFFFFFFGRFCLFCFSFRLLWESRFGFWKRSHEWCGGPSSSTRYASSSCFVASFVLLIQQSMRMLLKVERTLALSGLTWTNTFYLANTLVNCVWKLAREWASSQD